MTETTLAVANIVLTAIVLVLVLFIVHQARRLRVIAKGADEMALVGTATLSQLLRMAGFAADHSAGLASDLHAAQGRADAVEDGPAGTAADAASRSGDESS